MTIGELNDMIILTLKGEIKSGTDTWVEAANNIEGLMIGKEQHGKELNDVFRVLCSMYIANAHYGNLSWYRGMMYFGIDAGLWETNLWEWAFDTSAIGEIELYRGWVPRDGVADEDMVHSSWTTDYEVALYHATSNGSEDGKVGTIKVWPSSKEFEDLFVVAFYSDESEVVLNHTRLKDRYNLMDMKITEVSKDEFEPIIFGEG